MKPFFDVLYFGQNLLSLPLPASRPAPSIPLDEIYSIQIHNISLDLLVRRAFLPLRSMKIDFSRRSKENVYKKRPKFVPPSLTNRPFRNLVNRLSWLPTPPTSLEKQQHETIVTEEETIEISEVISVQWKKMEIRKKILSDRMMQRKTFNSSLSFVFSFIHREILFSIVLIFLQNFVIFHQFNWSNSLQMFFYRSNFIQIVFFFIGLVAFFFSLSLLFSPYFSDMSKQEHSLVLHEVTDGSS